MFGIGPTMNIAYLSWSEWLTWPLIQGQVLDVLAGVSRLTGRRIYFVSFQPLQVLIAQKKNYQP